MSTRADRPLLIAAAALAVALGAAIGLGGFTFVYARGASYLEHDSAACANCHVMGPHYEAWLKSSHRAVAECNDCHTPGGLVPKYSTKAMNGFRHSLKFTTGDFPEPIRATPANRDITEQACRRCHSAVVDAMDSGHAGQDPLSCVRCHGTVGHRI